MPYGPGSRRLVYALLAIVAFELLIILAELAAFVAKS